MLVFISLFCFLITEREGDMNPPYVIMAFSPADALQVAQALKAAKKAEAERILKPLNPPVITVEALSQAIREAGIAEAKLIR